MPSFLSEVKIIDLNRSKWDRKQSDPKRGEYRFEQKVYVQKQDYLYEATRHPHVFKWCRYEPKDGFSHMRTWNVKYQAEPVTPNDPYYPEGLKPNAEGQYVFGDVVLMKIPLEAHMARKKRDTEKANRAAKNRAKEFEDEAKKDGAEITDELREKLSKIGV